MGYGGCSVYTKKYGAKCVSDDCFVCGRNCCIECFMIRCRITGEFMCRDCRKCIQHKKISECLEDVLYLMDVNVIGIITSYSVCDCTVCALLECDDTVNDGPKMTEMQCKQCKGIFGEYMVSEC